MGEKGDLPGNTLIIGGDSGAGVVATPAGLPDGALAPIPTPPMPDGALNDRGESSGTTVEVVDGRGRVLPSINRDTPFWIRVRLSQIPGGPAGLGHDSGIAAVGGGAITGPTTITVQLQIGSDTRTVVLMSQPGDPHAFVSEPVSAHGYFTTSVPAEGVTSEPVSVTYTGASETVTVEGAAYANPVQQAWQATADTLWIYDTYWRQIATAMRDVPDKPETSRTLLALKAKSQQAISVLDKAHAWLNDPAQLLITQTQMANYALGFLKEGLTNFDPRSFEHGAGAERERIKDSSTDDILMPGLRQLTVAFYELVIGQIPLLPSFFTLVTGLTITGDDASRLEAAADVALQAVFLGMSRRLRVMDNVARRAPKMGRAIVAKVATGKNPTRGIREGTPVRAEGHGMLPQAARYANFVAEEEQVIIAVRGTNTGALADRAAGHPGKPALLKPKTINEHDILLGANPEAEGHAWVGYFKPKLPARPPGMTDAAWSELNARFNERMVEFDDCKVKMDHLVHDGLIRVDNGVVIDTGLCGNTGKAVTGDYDLWSITNRDGTPLSPDKLERVLNKLKSEPFHAEHGAHTDWKIDPTKMTAEDYQTALRVDAGVRAKHAPGKDSLVVFRGLSRPTIAGYEPTTPGPRLFKPLIPDGAGPQVEPQMPGFGGPSTMPGFPTWLPLFPQLPLWPGPAPSPSEQAADALIAGERAQTGGRPGKDDGGRPRRTAVLIGAGAAIVVGVGVAAVALGGSGHTASSVASPPAVTQPAAVPQPASTPPPAAVPTSPQPTATPTQAALAALLKVTALGDVLVVPVTTYSVTAEDAAGGALSYSWTMTPTAPTGMCGTPLVPWTRTGNIVPWSHSHNPPDNCEHLTTNHPVKNEVTITVLTGPDKGVAAVCDLLGSETQTITDPSSVCRYSP